MSAGVGRGLLILCNLGLAGAVGFADYLFFFTMPEKYKAVVHPAREGNFRIPPLVTANDPQDWNQYVIIGETWTRPKAPPPPPSAATTPVTPTPAPSAAPPPSILAMRVKIERVYYDVGRPARSACHLLVLGSNVKLHRAVGEKIEPRLPDLDWTIKEIQEKRSEKGDEFAYTIIFENEQQQTTTLNWTPAPVPPR